MAKPRHSPAQQRRIDEYEKELIRLKKRVKYAEKKGYVFSETPIPKRPKRITDKAIEQLREIKSFELSKKASYFVTETGEAVEAKYGRYRNPKPKTERQILASYKNIAKAQTQQKIRAAKKDYLKRNRKSIEETGKRIPILEKGYSSEQIKGKILADIYYDIVGAKGSDVAQEYLDSLPSEDYELFVDAYNVYGKKEANERILRSKRTAERKTRKDIPEDESVKYEQTEDKTGNIIDEGTKVIESTRKQVEKNDEEVIDYDTFTDEDYDWIAKQYEQERQREIDEKNKFIDKQIDLWHLQNYNFNESDIERVLNEYKEDSEKAKERLDKELQDEFEARERKAKEDDRVKAWKEKYEKQKYKPKSKREYVHDGDAIYDGIIFRLRQFDYQMNDARFRETHPLNSQYVNMFRKLLDNTIKTEGFDAVMRRLDGHGIEIDNAIEELCFRASSQEALNAAFFELAEIISGRALSVEESAFYSSYSEFMGTTGEENDGEIERD